MNNHNQIKSITFAQEGNATRITVHEGCDIHDFVKDKLEGVISSVEMFDNCVVVPTQSLQEAGFSFHFPRVTREVIASMQE